MKFCKTLFVLLLSLFAVGCASSADSTSSAASSSETSTAAQPEKSIVVYFSGTGHTKNVAEEIARLTGSELFEIEPANPYTADDLNYSDESSRVVQEHENEDAQTVPLVSTDVPDWASCQVVYLGYPIWWGDAAWPAASFVQAVDFSGKTVYPFCTSASSGAGQSAEHLEALSGTGTWMPAERFPETASEETVRDWLISEGRIAE